MDPLALLLLGLVIGAALGALLSAALLHRRAAAASAAFATQAEQQAAHQIEQTQTLMLARQEATVAQLLQHEAELRSVTEAELAAAQASVQALNQALAEVRQQQRDLIDAHRHEAAERERTESGQAHVMKTIAPVAQQLKAMQEKVLELEQQRATQHGELAEQIRSTRVSVEESRKAADSLASALTNNAVRGFWGETQLRTLVESAGLLSRVDFSLQTSMETESGARRPDMIINLPAGKQMAVDAKVPFNAFLDAQRDGIDPAERLRLLADHARRVRGHVDALGQKGYWTGLSASPEFTVAFIPNDQLLSAALEADPSLMEHAFKQGIVLATPTNLWGLLKTVAFTWKQDVLTEDAKQLFDLGRELYSRIVTLSSHAEKLRGSLERTVRNYNAFASSLESRVLVTARKLNDLDEAAVLGTPAPIDETPKPLTAGDFEVFADLERPEIPAGIDRIQAVDAIIVDDAEAV